MKHSKGLHRSILVLVTVLAIAMTVVAGFGVGLKSAVSYSGTVEDFSSGWTVTDQGQVKENVTLPYYANSKAGETFVLTKTVKVRDLGKTLSFLSKDNLITVCFGNVLIYREKDPENRRFGKAVGETAVLADLPNGSKGAVLRIEVTPIFDGSLSGRISAMKIGERDACIIDTMMTNLPKILEIFIIIAGSLVLMVLYFLLRRLEHDDRAVIFYSISSICISIYIFNQLPIGELLWSRGWMYSLVNYLSMAIAPIFFLEYYRRRGLGLSSKIYLTMQAIAIANFLIQCLLEVTNTLDFAEMSVVTEDLICIAAVLILIGLARLDKSKRSKLDIYELVAVCLFCAAIIIDVYRIQTIGLGDMALFFRSAALIYTLIMDYIYFKYLILLNMKKYDEINEALRIEKNIAEAADQEKSRFLLSISHELRTPMHTILGNNSMMMDPSVKAEDLEVYTRNIQVAGRNLLATVNNVLDFTRLEKNVLALETDSCDVSKLLQDVTAYAAVECRRKGLEFNVDVDRSLPKTILGDYGRMLQIYNNTLMNAIQYTSKGSVSVSVKWIPDQEDQLEQGAIVFAVRDDGPAIDQSIIDSISMWFDGEKEGMNRDFTGIGIELTTNCMLLQLMKGRLNMEHCDGQGNYVELSIPAKRIGQETLEGWTQAVWEGSFRRFDYSAVTYAPKARVHIVDDSFMNIDLFRYMLSKTGIQVDASASGQEILDKLRQGREYHMIFMDQMMPVMDGIETLHIIRQEKLAEGTPIIAFTANATSGMKQAYLDEGFDDYIIKPMKVEWLMTCLEKYLPEELIQRKAGRVTDVGGDTASAAGTEADIDTGSLADAGAGIDAGFDCECVADILDTGLGLQYCMDSPEFYREMIASYCESDRSQELEEAFGNKDYDNYRIGVHALKSTSLTIGALEMNEAAKALEQKVKDGDYEAVEAQHRGFMEAYSSLISRLSQALEGNADMVKKAVAGEDEDLVRTETPAYATEDVEDNYSLPDYGEVFKSVIGSAILVVDDDASNRRVAAEALGEYFRVIEADSAASAMEEIGRELPDLILLDVHMPGQDGFALKKMIDQNSEYADIPVIFLTADEDQNSEIRGFYAGASDFITKPLRKDISLQRIGRILELSYLRKNLQLEVEKQTEKAERRRRYVEDLSMQTVHVLASNIDASDMYTSDHSENVERVSVAIARELGWDEDQIRNLRYAALLHDVGKTAIADHVINKPGKLTDEEYEVIKQHTTLGGDILKGIVRVPELRDAALYHHEKYDGSGYPEGLSGESIPLVARIIAVADSFDAMSVNKVYNRSKDRNAIRTELLRCRGSQFDPAIVDAFIRVLDRGELDITDDALFVDQEADYGPDATGLILKTVMDSIAERDEGERIDPITGLLQRPAGEPSIALSMLENDGCLMFIDMDNLKKINDTMGHSAGDMALSVAGSVILENIRNNDIACRLGGDELLCFLPGIDEAVAEKRVKRILGAFDHKRKDDSQIRQASLSAGICMCKKGDDFTEACKNADKALYHVKQNGKAGYSFFREANARVSDVTKADLSGLLAGLQLSMPYTGAMEVEYREFSHVLALLSNYQERYNHAFKLVMVSMNPDQAGNPTFSVDDKENIMDILKKSIVESLRNVDICTRYSGNQFLIIITSSTEQSEVEAAMERIEESFLKRIESEDYKGYSIYYEVSQ